MSSALYDPKAAAQASKILQPQNLPPEFLAYMNDQAAVNQAPVPASLVMGASYYQRQLDANGTQLVIAGTAAETTLYSFDIGANLLGTNGCVECRLDCDYLNNSGSNKTITLKVKYGATTMYADTTSNIASDVDRAAFSIWVRLSAANSTAAQNVFMQTNGGTRVAPTTGISQFGFAAGGTGASIPSAMSGTATEDSTLVKTFALTITHSAADANTSFRRNYALLTKIGH